MKKVLTLTLLVLAFTSSVANEISQRVDRISSLIYSYPDSAFSQAMILMEDAKDANDEYGVVQSNFIIAYIYDDVWGDFGKAIIYYLEAIRFAEKSDYQQVNSNLASLNKNCGVIFRKFNAYELATNYYSEALRYARLDNNIKQVISIQYNLSGIYRDQRNHSLAISTLLDILGQTETDSKKYFEILNRLSATYYEDNDFDQSIQYSELLLKSNCPYTKLQAYSNNILGRAYMQKMELNASETHLYTALDIIETNPDYFSDSKAKLDVLSDLGEVSRLNNKPEEALAFYREAEGIMPGVTQDPEYFQVYKSIADLLFEQQNYQTSKVYEDLYTSSLNNYLDKQREIQETDKRYNMDLITKRYFDEVAKQEQVASILMYSKLISGTLLFLLLFSLWYNWYQKARLRKSIAQELIDLKMIR